jgi:CheY-like chemotaxis protein
VEVVISGKEVLAALEQHTFDLLLMDVQMPEMDGLETTSLIREQEHGTPRHLPIIAMTAHAMKGDRERCLAAGMDGYVSKPIRSAELFQAIADLCSPSPLGGEGWGEGAAATGNPSPLSPFTLGEWGNRQVWNKEQALARVDNDLNFLREIVRLFLEDCPVRMAEMREAITWGDVARLQRAVHTLKGALSNLEAPAAYKAAVHLESISKDSNKANIQAAYTKLEEAIHHLQPALAIILSS